MNKASKVIYQSTISMLALGYSGFTYAGTCSSPCTVSSTVQPEVRILDTSTGADGWEIEVNGDADSTIGIGLNGGNDGFFVIEDGAQDNQLVLDDNNNIGINTNAPQSSNELEVTGNSGPTDTFAAVAVSPGGPTDDSGRFFVNDFTDTAGIGVRTGGGGYRSPFVIDLDAGNNTLTIDSSGRVGIGTLLGSINKSSNLHVAGGKIFLDPIGTGGEWFLNPGPGGLWFQNSISIGADAAVKFGNGAPVNSLVVEETTGDIGLGTALPTASLHLTGDDGNTKFRVEETLAVKALRTMFTLNNYGPPSFTLQDISPGGIDWLFRSSNSGQFAFSTPSTGVVEMILKPGGNMVIAGSLTAAGMVYPSSRKLKEDFAPVDSTSVLRKVAAMPISEWGYKTDKGDIRHVGPMAEDFYAAFGMKGGRDDRISSIDMSGITLAAVKGLNQQIVAKNQEIEELKIRMARLENLVSELASSDKSRGVVASVN